MCLAHRLHSKNMHPRNVGTVAERNRLSLEQLGCSSITLYNRTICIYNVIYSIIQCSIYLSERPNIKLLVIQEQWPQHWLLSRIQFARFFTFILFFRSSTRGANPNSPICDTHVKRSKMLRKFAVSLNSLKFVCNPVVSTVQSRFNSTSSYVQCNDNPKILITGKYCVHPCVFKRNPFRVCARGCVCVCWQRFVFLLGGLGQLGIECAKLLRGKYGADSVILSDIIKPTRTLTQGGPYIFADILDFKVSKIKSRMDFFSSFSRLAGTNEEEKKTHTGRVNQFWHRSNQKPRIIETSNVRDWNAMLIFTGSSKNRCRSSYRLDNSFFSAAERNRRTKCSAGRQVRCW